MLRKGVTRLLAAAMGVMLAFGGPALTACAAGETSVPGQISYEGNVNWAHYGVNDGKGMPVDLFIVPPTVVMGEDGRTNADPFDEKVRWNEQGAINQELPIFSNYCRIYCPYYAQMTMVDYILPDDLFQQAHDYAYAQIKASFEAYLKNCNNGRPIIIAGFSQGGDMALELLKDYFNDTELSKQLVAAYVFGWNLADADLKAYPGLKAAQAADDTGVIISYECVADGYEGSPRFSYGDKSLKNEINPLNWKTDSTVASKEENKGMVVVKSSGKIVSETPAAVGAYIDEETGDLRITGLTPDQVKEQTFMSIIDPSSKYYEIYKETFPEGTLHLNDLRYFHRNLEENVATRINAYFAKQQ